MDETLAYQFPETYADASMPDDTAWGYSAETAKQTIQAAIDVTKEGGTVFVADGTYNTGSTLAPDGEPTRVVVSRGITVQVAPSTESSGGTTVIPEPTIDGTLSVRAVYVATNSAIEGQFIVQNGVATNGAALFVAGGGMASNLVVEACQAAEDGGGIYVAAHGKVLRGRVSSCSAGGNGGGVYAESLAELIGYTRSFNCEAEYGGGFYLEELAAVSLPNQGDTLTATTCSASEDGGGFYLSGAVTWGDIEAIYEYMEALNNTAQNGGGIYCRDAGVLDRLKVSENSALGYGGGIYAESKFAQTQFRNSLLADNQAQYYGGGIYAEIDTTLVGCTIVSNRVDLFGGIRVGGGIHAESAGYARNCIIWGNHSIDGTFSDDIYEDGNYNFSFDFSCFPADYTVAGVNNVHADPLLDEDCFLTEYSPCINAGNNSYLLSSDKSLLLWQRVLRAVVDLGCQESTYETPVLTGDIDEDGILDEWETTWFDTIGDCVATNNDDGDIFNNLEEYIAGTCPTNTDSCFLITNQLRTAQGLQLQWGAVSGRVYAVEWTDSLTNDFRAVEGMTNLTDAACTIPDDSSQGFYRLKVGLE